MANKERSFKRIRRELARFGMTRYGPLKMTSRYLPTQAPSEGVIYRHARRGLALIVATDEHIIPLEHHAGFYLKR